MKIDALELGMVYAYRPGHTPNIEPIIVLAKRIYASTPTKDGIEVCPTLARGKKDPRINRGVLVMAAPAEVWDLARAGKSIDYLPSIKKIYDDKLIITDNLPEWGDQLFTRSEFTGIKHVWPAHIAGRFAECIPEHDARLRAREEKRSRKLVAEQKIRDNFVGFQERAAQLGAGNPTLRDLSTVQMSLDGFIRLMALASGERKR
jgi:hypothetical protein